MAHLLRMPSVLAGANEAVLLAWTVEVGASFAEGDSIAEIETDKALVELAAEESAILGRTLVSDGTKVRVGDPIAVLATSTDTDDDIEAVAVEGGGVSSDVDVAATSDPEPDPATITTASGPSPENGRLFVSPLVRRLAREQGIDPASIPGTGPGGRIVRRDLEAWLASQPEPAAPEPAASAPAASAASASDDQSAAGFEDVPHSGMRRAIARRLTESKSTVPHFYVSSDLRVDRLLELLAEVNATDDVQVSVNDLLVKAIGTAFRRVPEANVIWTDDALRRFDTIDVAVAVATDTGLLTPVVRDVASQSLTRLSATMADLVERARSGRLLQHELEGGAFSISNLGMYGTPEFSAILNPPQSGILAVGAVRDAVVVDDGAPSVAKVMTVTMSVDHRAVDGALAAQWLAAFTAVVENPVSMLV
jgi:pyruvate dehydrogenase E2 component (dihydrolipoamide acetyltransferase)